MKSDPRTLIIQQGFLSRIQVVQRAYPSLIARRLSRRRMQMS